LVVGAVAVEMRILCVLEHYSFIYSVRPTFLYFNFRIHFIPLDFEVRSKGSGGGNGPNKRQVSGGLRERGRLDGAVLCSGYLCV